jgi:hypothetical protein
LKPAAAEAEAEAAEVVAEAAEVVAGVVSHAAVRQQAADFLHVNQAGKLQHVRHRGRHHGRKPGNSSPVTVAEIKATVIEIVKIARIIVTMPVTIARITATMPATTARTSLMTSGMITTIIMMIGMMVLLL